MLSNSRNLCQCGLLEILRAFYGGTLLGRVQHGDPGGRVYLV